MTIISGPASGSPTKHPESAGVCGPPGQPASTSAKEREERTSAMRMQLLLAGHVRIELRIVIEEHVAVLARLDDRAEGEAAVVLHHHVARIDRRAAALGL